MNGPTNFLILGTAFALNAMIETERVRLLGDVEPIAIKTPSASGTGQLISRCSDCHVAVWSNYGGDADKDLIRFVRVGSLDQPNALGGPDIHIFTSTKQQWVNLNESTVPVVPEYYDRKQHWPNESLDRYEIVREKMRTVRIRRALAFSPFQTGNMPPPLALRRIWYVVYRTERLANPPPLLIVGATVNPLWI